MYSILLLVRSSCLSYPLNSNATGGVINLLRQVQGVIGPKHDLASDLEKVISIIGSHKLYEVSQLYLQCMYLFQFIGGCPACTSAWSARY